MKLPFSIEQFLSVFAQYNEKVWPAQILRNLLALGAVIALYLDSAFGSRIISTLLAFLWGWMGFAYHFAFFTVINPTAWLFGALFHCGSVLVRLGWQHSK